ncbi:MAG: hypothetical protein EOP45_11485 [Sphingobacteriaceae bacterium]|nr:MAG: hypothetical protein EOP45_11485 [Sphingobacteriaceae bacterium]
MCRQGEIDDRKRKQMIAYNTQTPRIYALPKIHKNDMPLRQIVSTVDSPATALSIYIDEILKKILHRNYDVTNSMDLVKRLRRIKLNKLEILLSFDIIMLFPSIPVEFLLQILENRWREIKRHTNMSKELFMNIMKFIITDSSFFEYNNTVYKQIDGVAMGQNIAPTLANLVTDEILDTILPKLTFLPKLLVKYVDDLFAIIPANKVNEMLKALNSVHPSIQFTHELEHEDGTLPYLDIKLIKAEDGRIITDWYNKETASNKLLNFHSNHPFRMKCNVAFNMFYRVLSLSDVRFHDKNIKKCTDILRKNSYPLNIITKQMHRAFGKINGTQPAPAPNTDSNPKYRSVVYVKGLSEKVNCLLSHTANDIKIAPKPIRQLKSTLYTKLKQKRDVDETTHCIYKVPCKGDDNNPCEKCYVGQTKNSFKNRKRTHRHDTMPNNNKGQTALAVHVGESKHTPDFDNAIILATERNWSKRLTMESLHIQSNTTCNFRVDRERMSSSYCALLKSHNNK